MRLSDFVTRLDPRRRSRLRPQLAVSYVRISGPAHELLSQRFGLEMGDAEDAQPYGSSQGSLRVGIASHLGGRPHNEDSAVVVVVEMTKSHGTYPVVFACVADGMGGMPFGDVAGATALQVMTNYILDHLVLREAEGHVRGFSTNEVARIMSEGLQEANHDVLLDAPGGGTTATCLLLRSREAYLAHVGDSRAYLIDTDGLRVLTRDHSLVQRLEDLGQLTHEQAAARHKQRNYLYRALGIPGEIEADFIYQKVLPGSALLLCTDGLWDTLGDEAVWAIVGRRWHPQEMCDTLVSAAVSAGSSDNVTAVMVETAE